MGPDDLIASHVTRVGRFRAINPTKPRKLPSFSRVLGAVAWALFLGESVRRARNQVKGEPDLAAAEGSQALR